MTFSEVIPISHSGGVWIPEATTRIGATQVAISKQKISL
jgi:hypothetical protein